MIIPSEQIKMSDFDKIDHKSRKIRGLKTVSDDVHNTKHYDVK